MSKEIIIGEKKQDEEKQDKIYELVRLFTISREILGEEVTIKKKYNGDGTILMVLRNNKDEFLEVRYPDNYIQMNVKFTLHKGIDDKLIEQIKKLAKEDEDYLDRFFVKEDKNIYGAIMIGLEQFEEIFPKMHAYS